MISHNLNINEEILIKIMEESQIPGVSIAYIDANGIIETKQLGITHPHSKNRVENETVFGVASLSKVVFAYLILKLCQQGDISLNMKINEILPFKDIANDFCEEYSLKWKRIPGDEKLFESLTVGMVLTHTTGLPNDTIGFDFIPGTEYGYSGIAMVYLQKVIEKLLSADLETIAKKYVFDPLRMNHSSFQQKYDLKLLFNDTKRTTNTLYIESTPDGLIYEVIGLDNKLKKGFIGWNQFGKYFPHNIDKIILEKAKLLPTILNLTAKKGHTQRYNPSPVAANSLFTTPYDYALLINAWMHDKQLQDTFTPLISMITDSWAKAVGVQKKDLEKVGWGLGMGLQLDEKGAAISAYHSGDMNEWRAWVAINMNDKKMKTAIIYFTNSKNGHVLAEHIISPHVRLNNALNYFSKKYGFAIKHEPDWRNKEQERFKTIRIYSETGSNKNIKKGSLFFNQHHDGIIMQQRFRFYSAPEIGIDGGSVEYSLNDTLSFVLKGDSKAGPSLVLKVDGHKMQRISIEKQEAYKIMSMAEEKPLKLLELVQWLKDKDEKSWSELANNIELNSKTGLKHN